VGLTGWRVAICDQLTQRLVTGDGQAFRWKTYGQHCSRISAAIKKGHGAGAAMIRKLSELSDHPRSETRRR